MSKTDWKSVNDHSQISTRSAELKTQLRALSEQRREPLDATIKAVLEAGIQSLCADKRARLEVPERGLVAALDEALNSGDGAYRP